jgi:integrase
LNSKNDNTIKSYLYAFKRWEQFISLHGHCAIPAQPAHVALYLTSLLNNGSSFHPVCNAVYGIKWAHEINGPPDPATHTFVASVLEASKCIAVKPTEKKEPISPDTLIELYNMFKDSVDLLIVRDLAMILLSFSGFLRYDEVSSLRFNDVKVYDNHLVLHLEKSQTDRYRQSSDVLIAKGSTVACPYSMFLRYVSLAGFSSSSKTFLFRQVCRSGSICKIINKDKKTELHSG